jgi:hypothetical protein
MRRRRGKRKAHCQALLGEQRHANMHAQEKDTKSAIILISFVNIADHLARWNELAFITLEKAPLHLDAYNARKLCAKTNMNYKQTLPWDQPYQIRILRFNSQRFFHRTRSKQTRPGHRYQLPQDVLQCYFGYSPDQH